MSEVPRESGFLDVTDGQRIYWEEWGHPEGTPILYLHGGPGGGLGASGYRRRADLERSRVVGFEQRGCGRSVPHASDPLTDLAVNTTAHLIGDIEALRADRDIERWVVNGVSWGSTLALAYAQTHPERVAGLVLVAVTTTSRREVDWITEGVGMMYPEAWDRLAAFAEDSGIGYRRDQGRLIDAYAQLMRSSDSALRDAASKEWALWEDTHVSIGAGGFSRDPRWESPAYRLAFATLTTHYWSHSGFGGAGLLAGMGAIADIPGVLIHGRKDISGPVMTAWEVHRAWPASRVVIDEGDGHGGSGMIEAWSRANDELVAAVRARGEA